MSNVSALIKKPTAAQLIRRQDAVVKLTVDGYAASQIAAALQVSVSTVTNDRNERWQDLKGAPKMVPAHRRKPDPEPVDWWTDLPPGSNIPPSYVLSGPVPRIKGTLDYLRESNARARFAFNLAEAAAAGDEEYVIGAQLQLDDLIKYLQEMQRIAQDQRAADHAKRHGRDDLLKPSTVPQVADKSVMQSLRAARGLPPPGAGVIPGRMYAYLWSCWWAGQDLLDERVLAKAGSREGNLNATRVRAAAEELLTVLGPPPRK